MPKVVDHHTKRDELAEAVWRAIARTGIESTTIREIAQEAGCSTGVLAHYFVDKRSLLLYSLQLATNRATRRMEARAAEQTGVDALRAVLFEALPLDRERRMEWRVWLAFWGQATADPALSAEQRRRYGRWRRFVRDLLSASFEHRERPGDIDLEADALVALIDGIGVQATFEPRGMTTERQMSAVDAHLARLTAI